MSYWVHRPKMTSTYISKLDLMPSHQKTLCPSTAQNEAFVTTSTPIGTENLPPISAGQSSVESHPGNATSSPADVSSRAHLSRLDVTLMHVNRGKALIKDNQCMFPSNAAACHAPWNDSSCKDPQCSKACTRHGSFASRLDSEFMATNHEKQNSRDIHNAGCSAEEEGPVDLSMFIPSEQSPTSQPPCWTSRLDVALASGQSVSPPQTTFTSGNPDSTHQDHSQVSNLQASVKLYISTCSIAVKPSREENQGNNHAYSVLLVPQLGKVSNSSSSFSGRSQVPKDGFPPTEAPTLQVTQFQVTSSPDCPSPYQTSTRHVGLSPAMLTRGKSSPKSNFSSDDSDLEYVIFPNHPATGSEFRKTPSSEFMTNDHDGSKVTLILATPLTAMPIQVIRECGQTTPNFTNPCCCLNTGGPSLTVGIGGNFPLSISPTCCTKLPSSNQTWIAHSTRNMHPEELYRTIPVSPVKSSLGDGTAAPSISVNIGTFRSGRRVVKISVSTSQKAQDMGNRFSDGYRNIILGY